MSLRALTTVWDHSKARGTLLLLELAIADTANDKGLCWPGIDFLARKSRMDRRSVVRLLQELENLGELLVERNTGPKGTNRYLLLLVSKGVITSLEPDMEDDKVSPLTKCHGDNDTKRLSPEPSGTEEPPSPGEWPSEEQVSQYAKAYPGNLAIGIPPEMTPRWAQDYFDYNTFNIGRWPVNWKEDMKRRYEKDWQSGLPKARGELKPKSSKPLPNGSHKKNDGRERGEILQELAHARKSGAAAATIAALKEELKSHE